MCLELAALGSIARSQVKPDFSLEAEASIVTPQGFQDLVTGGARRGSGLFHSFEELNVPEGRSLYFTQPNGIDQIFSRVTGNSPSQINGTLGILGNADLFLLNPKGILFGPQAQLDLAGSFIASSAESLQFEGGEFSAIAPGTVPILTMSRPTGLRLGLSPGEISNQSRSSNENGTGLTVSPFQTLALIGGDVAIKEGAIRANSSRVELGSVTNGIVSLTPISSGFELGYAEAARGGTIQITNQGRVASRVILDNPQSGIYLVGDRLLLDQRGFIASNNFSPYPGATVELNFNSVEILNGSSIGLGVISEGLGSSLTINATDFVTLRGVDSTFGTGGNSGIISGTAENSRGSGGPIIINTGRLQLENGGAIFSDTGFSSKGDGTDITINATQSVIGQNNLLNELRTNIGSQTLGSGQAGDISIITSQLELDEVYRIQTVSLLDGAGGDISIDADSISLSGANPFSQLFPSGIISFNWGSGSAGDIAIKTQSLSVSDSSNIVSTTFANRDEIAAIFAFAFGSNFLNLLDRPGAGIGNAGNISVTADSILVTGISSQPGSQPSNINSTTNGIGDAGNVEIETRLLVIEQGGVVGSSSFFSFPLFDQVGAPTLNSGRGNGGNLTVHADRILVDGIDTASGIPSFLGTQTLSFGDAGDTVINTRELEVRKGGLILAGTSTSGNGGRLNINARDSIVVDGPASKVGTFADAPNEVVQDLFKLPAIPEGDIGTLQLQTERLDISHGATVSVAHQGSGNAGALRVDAEQLRLRQDGAISAISRSGQGGNIDLQVDKLISLRQSSRITAEALGGSGNGGNLNIETGAILAIPAENSDIIANAAGGTGGQITLRMGGLFGIEFQEQLSDTSGITASSQIGLDGTVNIDLLAVDPSQGLTELPTSPLNPNEQISTACNSRARSKFVTTGRGGLPNDPRQQLQSQRSLQDWRDPGIATTEVEYEGKARPSPLSLELQSERPIEAQVLRRDRQGKVHLMAQGNSPTAITPSPSCSVKAPSALSQEAAQ